MINEAALQCLRDAQRVLVAPHRRPDADALGSALGLAVVLRALGKDVSVFVPEPLPLSLRFLAEDEEIVSEIADGERFDAVCLTDVAAKKLVPAALPGREVTGPQIVIDHHSVHDSVGDHVIRDVRACATGEVIVRISKALGLATLPARAALPLYAAIVADTGGFRYASTTPATLRLGADLLEAGVDPWRVAYELFEGWEAPRLRLLSAVLDTLEIAFDGRVAILRITRQMLADCGANDDMVEGIVNYARSVRGVEVGVLLWEWPETNQDGTPRIDTKVSFRSRGSIDVTVLAVPLGGGGHRAAAATQVHASIEDTARRVHDELARLFA